jgi:hypothetical protein
MDVSVAAVISLLLRVWALSVGRYFGDLPAGIL